MLCGPANSFLFFLAQQLWACLWHTEGREGETQTDGGAEAEAEAELSLSLSPPSPE